MHSQKYLIYLIEKSLIIFLFGCFCSEKDSYLLTLL